MWRDAYSEGLYSDCSSLQVRFLYGHENQDRTSTSLFLKKSKDVILAAAVLSAVTMIKLYHS